MYIDISNMVATKKRWDEVKTGDIVEVDTHQSSQYYQKLGCKIRYITVEPPKFGVVLGVGGQVTLHFEVGTSPIGYRAKYDSTDDVFITVYTDK